LELDGYRREKFSSLNLHDSWVILPKAVPIYNPGELKGNGIYDLFNPPLNPPAIMLPATSVPGLQVSRLGTIQVFGIQDPQVKIGGRKVDGRPSFPSILTEPSGIDQAGGKEGLRNGWDGPAIKPKQMVFFIKRKVVIYYNPIFHYLSFLNMFP